jgi:hypothetical protein
MFFFQNSMECFAVCPLGAPRFPRENLSRGENQVAHIALSIVLETKLTLAREGLVLPGKLERTRLRQGSCHIALYLCLRQGNVVDTNFVDQSLEVLTVYGVATDLQRVRRRGYRPALRRARHERSIHVNLQSCSVIRHR